LNKEIGSATNSKISEELWIQTQGSVILWWEDRRHTDISVAFISVAHAFL